MFSEVVPTVPSIREAVSSYANTVESASDLGLLRTVETTTDALCDKGRFFRAHAGTGRFLAASIQAMPVKSGGECLDPDGIIDTLLERFVDVLEADLALLTSRKGSIDQDHRLREHHCDQLHSAYDELLQSIAGSIDVTRDVMAALVAHDLNAEPRDGNVFPRVADMHKAIRG